jgi:hypothetical protein
LHSCPDWQALQALPPAPQLFADSLLNGMQLAPLQQPLGQLLGVHRQSPLTHACPDEQLRQALPPTPHWELVSLPVAMQRLPLQQPLQLEVVQSATH